MTKNQLSRRKFLATTSAAVAIPYFVPSTALGLGKSVAPSDRIAMAAIGCGGKGQHNTGEFLKDERVQFVAACDVDQKHLETATEAINRHYGNDDCVTIEDFRDLVVRKDIDAVHVSTPDHGHAVASVRAMLSGKDVYCEKPLANSFGESRAIRDTQRKTGQVLQCGSHERSTANCRFAAELVRNGRIGKVETVRIQMPCEQDHHLKARKAELTKSKEVPENLNWDFWQGHTGPVDFNPDRCHFWWRFVLAYGGGEMTDRGAHILDIAQLALDMDDSGPVKFEASGVQNETGLYDAFWDYKFTNTYENGVKLIGSTEGPRGLKFEGSDGWLFVAIHGGALTASNPEILPRAVRDGGSVEGNEPMVNEFSTQLGRSPGHHKNFIDCVISRSSPMATAEIGHRTATICHLNNIAMKVGKPLTWDPGKEELVGNVDAGEMLVPNMRSPWTV